MKNKKKLLTLAIAGLLTIGAIGAGTLAFFTDADEKTNIITMGDISAELTEPNYGGDENGEIKNIVPNQTFTKDPTITMGANSNDAYARAHIKISATKPNETFQLTAEEIAKIFAGINVDTTTWFVDDADAANGNYVIYYKDVLTAGQVVQAFTEVTIPEDFGNRFSGVSIKMDVKAEVIQAENFAPTVANGMITSWGNVTIEAN